MNRSLSDLQIASPEKPSFGRLSAIMVVWMLFSMLITFARLNDQSFGIQGDLPLHYHITRSFARSLSEGDLLPRWAGLLDGGHGDALFTFYPPFFYWLSAIPTVAFGIDALQTLKWLTFLIALFNQATVYLLARSFFNRSHSLVASAVSVSLPALAMIVLNRGLLPNGLALCFLPLVILGAHISLVRRQCARGVVLCAASFSAIILTHVITSYLCMLALGMMAAVYLPQFGWRAVARLAGSLLLALALTAFYLVPEAIEMEWAQIRLVAWQDYRYYFLFSAPADSSYYRQSWAGFNYVASLATLAQTALAFALAVGCWQILRLKRTKSYFDLAHFLWFSLVIAAFGVIISLPFSAFLWRSIPMMSFVQFPWRMQPFVVLGISVMAAALINEWAQLNRSLRLGLAAVLFWLLVSNLFLTFQLARSYGRMHSREEVTRLLTPHNLPPITHQEAVRLQQEGDLGFLPYAANQVYFRPQSADLKLYPPVNQVGGLTIITGRGEIQSQQLTITSRKFQLKIEEPIRARLETYHYPHWVARLDERELEIGIEPGGGLMLVDLPAGEHTLRFDFEVRNRIERLAQWLSVSAWLLLLGWSGRMVTDHHRLS